MREPPHACRPRHAHPSTPHHARGSWEAQRAKSFTAVKTAPPARAPFWAWPNNVSRLCVAQARGLLSVYKQRGTLLYPFTCARAVGAAPTVTPSRAGEVNQGKTEDRGSQSNAKTKDAKKQRGGADSPGKTLAGDGLCTRQGPCRGSTPKHQQSEPPLSPRPQTPSTALGQGSGGTSVVACRSFSRP